MHDIPKLFAPPSSAYASRREFLAKAGGGFGLLALAGLLQTEKLLGQEAAPRGPNPLAPHSGHHAAKAKSVIWLFINGGPSHVDTWDYKPELERRDGQELPGFDRTTGFFIDQGGPLMRSPFRFRRCGQSAPWVSEIFPHTARHVDDIAFVHSCHTETNNHAPALFQINSGLPRMGFPSVGSWVTYGLGTANQNLPGFVVMYDTLGRGLPKNYAQNWGAGFLPGIYQGTALNPQGAPINNLNRSGHMTDGQQRRQIDLMQRLNRRHQGERPGDAELAARIESFEL